MKQITIYSRPTCPFCIQAKNLLQAKNLSYQDIDIDWQNPEKKEEMIKKTEGKSSVPQIFVDGKLIGGCDDLYELDEKGELDAIIL